MEKIGVGSRVSMPTLRSVCLIGLFSLLSGSHSSQEVKSDHYSFSNPDFIEAYTAPSSVLLDTTAARDKSILYYHIARDKYGKFDVCERAMRVMALTPRIYAAGDAVGMSDQTKEYFRAKIFVESGGDSLAVSTAGARWVAQILKSTAAPYGWYKTSDGRVYDKRNDITRSLQTAAKIHHQNYKELWDWSLAFATYHMWIGNMRKIRALYKASTGEDLVSFDQLYATMPPQTVTNSIRRLNDDTFGYWIKIRNAVTLLRLYEKDPAYFDYLESLYADLPYDARGIVSEQIIFSHEDYLHSHDDVCIAIQSELLQELDHSNFVCGSYEFENFLSPDVQTVLDSVEQMYGKPIRIDCGFLPGEIVGDISPLINKRQTLRLGSHSTGRSFDISAPENYIKGNKVFWSSDYNRLEMALTLLRYQWKIVWCVEFDPDKTKVLHFHITVLPFDR
jgi:hypothetical protein